MLYLVHGTDNGGAREKVHELLGVLSAKKPNAEIFRVTSEDWSDDKLTELIGGQGLFERKNIALLDTILSSKETLKEIAESFLTRLEEMAGSDNVFIVLEKEIDAKALAKFEKKAQKVWKCDIKARTEKKDFNVFALTDAFGRRDKKTLWALYQKAILNGSEPEELHGLLFWQVKSLLVAAQAKSADEAGLKPFVWSKAQSFLKNFKEGELSRISSSLVNMYHRARRGEVDFEVELEMFVLGV